ncbi:hypothetical protein GINT2_001986 [Glugoides intestinalis]
MTKSNADNKLKRAKHWAYTDNVDVAIDREWDIDFVEYAVWQLEKGCKSGKLHIQGFVTFKKQEYFNKAKEHIGKHAHISIARTPSKAASYFMKTDTAEGNT